MNLSALDTKFSITCSYRSTCFTGYPLGSTLRRRSLIAIGVCERYIIGSRLSRQKQYEAIKSRTHTSQKGKQLDRSHIAWYGSSTTLFIQLSYTYSYVEERARHAVVKTEGVVCYILRISIEEFDRELLKYDI